MEFVPRRLPGLLVGAGISLGMLVLAAVFAWHILQTPVSIVSFLLGVAGFLTILGACLFFYWTLACWRLRYAIDQNSLLIRWGPIRHTVPLTFVERAFAGEELRSQPKVSGLNWTGYHVGLAQAEATGPIVFYSTHARASDLVYIVTPGLSYAISPPNPRGFIAQLDERKEQCSGPQARPKAERWSPLRLPIWRDRYAQAIALAGLVVNAALFAYVTYYFPSLPDLLPMHFTVFGEVDLIGFRNEVLKLPAMAFFVFGCNLFVAFLLHSKERLAAYLCLVAATFVQVVFWVATTRIVY